jgi:hypothetical protein
MPDPLTLGALALGAVCLLLWYTLDESHRHRQAKDLTRRVTRMVHDKTKRSRGVAAVGGADLPARLLGTLPSHLDARDVDTVVENLLLFRNSPDTLSRFFIYLRDRYHSRWELSILENITQKFNAEVAAMEAAAKRHTIPDRVATEVATARLERQRKERELADYQHTAPHDRQRTITAAQASALDAENQLLKARAENAKLKRQLAGDRDGEKMSPEQAAYERARQRTRTQRAEQKGAFDEELALREQLRQEFEAKKRAIEDDPNRSPEEKAADIKRLRTQYAKIFAREY